MHQILKCNKNKCQSTLKKIEFNIYHFSSAIQFSHAFFSLQLVANYIFLEPLETINNNNNNNNNNNKTINNNNNNNKTINNNNNNKTINNNNNNNNNNNKGFITVYPQNGSSPK